MGVRERWQARLRTRRGLLAKARASVVYWGRRAGSAHGRAMLAEARARYALRQRQVAEAERVVARHSPVASMSDRGVAFVAGFEGFRARPYHDAKGVLTQGYGETQQPLGGTWTRAYALGRLRRRLNDNYLAPVLRLAKSIGLSLSQNEADALGSLSYNLGPGIFDKGRTMGDAMRSKNKARIADAFLVYDEPNNPAVHAGLARRRRAERALFKR